MVLGCLALPQSDTTFDYFSGSYMSYQAQSNLTLLNIRILIIATTPKSNYFLNMF